jgi:NADH dehydrogenase FAD-containing subunit
MVSPCRALPPWPSSRGANVARVTAARMVGKATPRPLRYHNRGLLATIGRRAAVIEGVEETLGASARLLPTVGGAKAFFREAAALMYPSALPAAFGVA